MPVTAIQPLSSLRIKLDIPNKIPMTPGKTRKNTDTILSAPEDRFNSEDSNSVNRTRNITDSANKVRDITPRFNLLVEFSIKGL